MALSPNLAQSISFLMFVAGSKEDTAKRLSHSTYASRFFLFRWVYHIFKRINRGTRMIAELNEASNGIKRPQIMKVDLRKIIGSVFNNLLIEPVLNRKDQPSQTETKHINSVAPFSRTVIR